MKLGIITYISPSIHNILGYRPDQVLGNNWREFVDNSTPEYAELENMERMRFAGLETPPFSAWVLHANGSNRLFEFRDAPLKDADGRVIANEGIGKDITERHEAELALRQAREELQRGVQEATAELTQEKRRAAKEQGDLSLDHSRPLGVHHSLARRRRAHICERLLLPLLGCKARRTSRHQFHVDGARRRQGFAAGKIGGLVV